MQRAVSQHVLDRLVPVVVGAAIVGFALGSSSVPSLTRVGHSLRWALLAVLLGVAVLWCMPRVVPPRRATVAAAVLVALSLLSTAWSVEPRTTFERSVSLALLFCTCLALAAAARRRPERAAAVLGGVLGGAVVVGLAGLLLLAFDHHRAVQSASYEAPSRFTGLGQDPNTVSLLFAVVIPVAVWALIRPRRRAAAAVSLAVLAGTIVASGSRGALVAGGVGALVTVAALGGRRRPALLGAAAVVVCVAAGAAVQSIPKPSATSSPSVPVSASTAPKPKPGFLDADASYPLDADVGRPLPGGGEPPVRRGLVGASGRLDAWQGALHEAARRPVAGHGFGTEQAVFVDRYYRFVGGLPESSYIGLALQLGIVGLAALGALVAVLGRAGIRALRGPRRDVAAAGLGVLAAGLAIAVVQSYLYSVGNIATAALWLTAFLLPSAVVDG